MFIDTSLIITCQGRSRHLERQLASIAHATHIPKEIIVVSNDAKVTLNALANSTLPKAALERLNVRLIPQVASSNGQFDIGRNRNQGAHVAKQAHLVFLDVDCLVPPWFFAQFNPYLQAHPQALVMAQPMYLTAGLTKSAHDRLLEGGCMQSYYKQTAIYNPHRPNLDAGSGSVRTHDYGAFWSLCFAVAQSVFETIGGFDPAYTGYGAEDTDFAFNAKKLGVDFYLTDAVVYHQQHAVYRPPLNHLPDIIKNANVFWHKWDHWPMAGWLAQFAAMGLIDWHDKQSHPIVQLADPTQAQLAAAHCPNAAFV